MNLIANNNIYPELIGGEVWFGKITDSLGEWYLKPRDRYRYISQWEAFIKEALPRADHVQPGEHTFSTILYNDGSETEEFIDPVKLSAEVLWKDIQNYGLKAGHTGRSDRLHRPVATLV